MRSNWKKSRSWTCRIESSASSNTVGRMCRCLRLEARTDADRALSRAGVRGGTVDQVFGHLDAMEQAIAARVSVWNRHSAQQTHMEQKRSELLEAMQYRKKLDLLDARAAVELRRRRERQDQQLLDERAWRRGPCKGRAGMRAIGSSTSCVVFTLTVVGMAFTLALVVDADRCRNRGS